MIISVKKTILCTSPCSKKNKEPFFEKKSYNFPIPQSFCYQQQSRFFVLTVVSITLNPCLFKPQYLSCRQLCYIRKWKQQRISEAFLTQILPSKPHSRKSDKWSGRSPTKNWSSNACDSTPLNAYLCGVAHLFQHNPAHLQYAWYDYFFVSELKQAKIFSFLRSITLLLFRHTRSYNYSAL